MGMSPAVGKAAAPQWDLSLHHNEGHFAPGAINEYWLDVRNIGDAASSGQMKVAIAFPPGMSLHAVVDSGPRGHLGNPPAGWSCAGSPGDALVTCTWIAAAIQPGAWASPPPISNGGRAPGLLIDVAVAPQATGVLTPVASVSGGGAPDADIEEEPTIVSPDPAKFGIVPETWKADFHQPDANTPVRQAGAHPYQADFAFDMNSIINAEASKDLPPAATAFRRVFTSSGTLRNLTVDLPAGFVGNPTALGECSEVQLNANQCPPSSQVGRIDLHVAPPGIGDAALDLHQAVYNMRHPRGVITDFAFSISAVITVHIRSGLDASDYHVTTTVPNTFETALYDQKLTIWGVPADPRHDIDRCTLSSEQGIGSTIRDDGSRCATDLPVKPFITMPGQCQQSDDITVRRVESWQDSGVYGPQMDWPQPGFQQTGCEKLRFDPRVSIHPVSQAANTPTGLDVHIQVPQNENPNALDTAHVKSTVVTFPKGMTLSPSFADGLQACGLDQIGLGTNDPISCPDASRIGTVDLTTPLLPNPLEGSMFLAKQKENPFGSLLAMYLVIHDTEDRGVLLKVPGRIDLDQKTGQIVTTFDQLPQLPFDDLSLRFRSGPRAPLINPASCGTKTIGIEVVSHAQPDVALDASDSYEVLEGPAGHPCVNSEAERPFDPKISGGTLNPQAGSFSPFLFRMTRTDADQELSQIGVTVPPGLTAKLAGIPFCSDAAISAISSELATGLGELGAPHCPVASQIGTVSAGVGAGLGPNYFPGKIYLAGPYKGAPLSLAVVIASLAGPFDLGNVVVRTALHVNPETAQVRALSDPFPLIFHGVLLRVRDVRINLDRNDLTLNPTNCDPLAIDAHLTGTGGDILTTADDTVADRSERFQVANCANLPFKPKLSFKLKGGTKRGQFPAFQAVLKARPGDANIAKSTVVLPRSEFIEQGHIRTVCTRVQFRANQCPAGSIYGHAKATTPLFDEVLEGPVYLRSNGGERLLPDLVVSLDGKIDVALAGFVDSVKGRVRNTFDVIPDAPVTKFVLNMRGGKKGLLVNHLDLCEITSRADVKLVGQNGKVAQSRPKMGTSCKGKARSKRIR